MGIKYEIPEIIFDPSDPLARVKPGESRKANAALRDYVYMGASRSIDSLYERYREAKARDPQYKPPTLSRSSLYTWSSRNRWQERLDRFLELEDERIQREWDERTRKIRESDYQDGEELRALHRRIMAEAPNFTKTRRRIIRGEPRVVDDNGKTIKPGEPDKEIITVQLDINLLIRALKTASDLQRLAAGLETEKIVSDVTERSIAVLPEEMSLMDEQQIAAALQLQARASNEIAARIIQRKPDKTPLVGSSLPEDENDNARDSRRVRDSSIDPG